MSASTSVLVTGAAGFIGSHLVDRLLDRGCAVCGLDNLSLGRRANLKQALARPSFTFGEIDVNDVDAASAFIKDFHARNPITMVWHLAANSDIQAGTRDPDVDLRLTFLTTYNTVKLMQRHGIRNIAFASSSAIYGDRGKALNEDTGPCFPISNYGAMKLASEAIISAALEQWIDQAWIFRFPNVVGDRSTHGVIFDFIRKLKVNPSELEVLGDGTQEKPYLHVSELLEAMLFINDASRQKLNYFNVAPENATTVRYIAEQTVAVASPQARIRYTGGSRGWVGDVPKFSYDTSKLKLLGWSPKLSSNGAIDRAIRENAAAAA